MTKNESTLQHIFREIAAQGEIPLRALARAVGLHPATPLSKLRALARLGLVELIKADDEGVRP